MNNEIYYRVKDLRKFIICRREYLNSEMQNFLNNPEEYLSAGTSRFFKKAVSEATTVGVVSVNGKKFVVKRYNVMGFWHGVKNNFRQNRAFRSWKNSHYLEQHNIDTPKPVAVLIERFGPIRGRSYFIAEYVDGTQGRYLFAKESKPQKEWEKMFAGVAKLLEKLYVARVTHDDFQKSNMIFVEGTPVLLDLDHMRIHLYNSFWFRHNYRKDVKNFLRVLGEINPVAQRLAENIFMRSSQW